MSKFILNTRYFILIPIVGLVIAAVAFFVFGGLGLINVLIEQTSIGLGLTEVAHEGDAVAEHSEIIFEVVEYVHTFLVGTVLYLTAVGLYQLFIGKVNFPSWMRVESTEQLETNLIGVTVVVLAVNFMGLTFKASTEIEAILNYGVGIAFPIAALGLFVGLRAWSAKLEHTRHEHANEDESDKQ